MLFERFLKDNKYKYKYKFSVSNCLKFAANMFMRIWYFSTFNVTAHLSGSPYIIIFTNLFVLTFIYSFERATSFHSNFIDKPSSVKLPIDRGNWCTTAIDKRTTWIDTITGLKAFKGFVIER